MLDSLSVLQIKDIILLIQLLMKSLLVQMQLQLLNHYRILFYHLLIKTLQYGVFLPMLKMTI